MEKYISSNGKQKKAGVAILISDKIDFKTQNIKRDKEEYYLMTEGSIQEEDNIAIVNIYAPNIGAPQYLDCSLPGSSAHGIFQARVLEWVAIAFS